MNLVNIFNSIINYHRLRFWPILLKNSALSGVGSKYAKFGEAEPHQLLVACQIISIRTLSDAQIFWQLVFQQNRPEAALRNESYTHRTTIQTNQKGIYYGELCDCELQDYQ